MLQEGGMVRELDQAVAAGELHRAGADLGLVVTYGWWWVVRRKLTDEKD
jgi:hypothetical protein